MKRPYIIILSISLLISFGGCYQYTNENYIAPSAIIHTAPLLIENPEIAKALAKAGDRTLKALDPKTIFDSNTTVTHKNMTYKINSVKIEKKTTMFKVKDIINNNNLIEPNGNLKEGYSYMLINITIKNNENIYKTQYVNTYNIFRIDKDFNYRYSISCSEIRAFDKAQNDIESKSYFKYDFKPNEESTFNFLYIAKDDELDKDLIMLVNDIPFTGKDYEDVKFIRINIPKWGYLS